MPLYRKNNDFGEAMIIDQHYVCWEYYQKLLERLHLIRLTKLISHFTINNLILMVIITIHQSEGVYGLQRLGTICPKIW